MPLHVKKVSNPKREKEKRIVEVQGAFNCMNREGICLFLLFLSPSLSMHFEQEAETSIQTEGFQRWPWACGTTNDDSILYTPHNPFASIRKKLKEKEFWHVAHPWPFCVTFLLVVFSLE